ncbi:MAG: magnesium transporter [bacterium]
MKDLLITRDLRDLIAKEDTVAIEEFCKSNHPAFIAELLEELSPEEAWYVLSHAEAMERSTIFSHLDAESQIEIIEILPREKMVRLISDMPPDDRADLFKKLPEERRDTILPALAQAEREDIRRLTAHEEGTAGAVMTSDYATLSPNMTIQQAIDHLRDVAPDKETIYYAYVVDKARKLLGFVSLKDLIISRRQSFVRDVMHEDMIYARTTDDQEEAARKIQKYDLLALPVINGGDALVGIITHDDAMDIIIQEHTEDVEKLMAITGSHEAGAYMRTSSWDHFKNRVSWVVLLAMVGLISGFIVQSFEGIFLQFTIFAMFMPMVADTGGNTGSQSATLVIRALALQEITPKDIFQILWKETKVSILISLVLAVFAFGRVMLFGAGSNIPDGYSLVTISSAISVALGLQVVSSTLIGALLPLGAAKLKWDPAVVASPALTTIVDVTGLLLFFVTAKLFLKL